MIPLTINQKKILHIFESQPGLKGSVTKLHPAMSFLSDRALQTNLQLLTKYGILQIETENDSWNRDIEVYSVTDSYKPNEKINIPTFEKLNDHTSVPSIPTTPSVSSMHSVPNKNQIDSEDTEGVEQGNRIQTEESTVEEFIADNSFIHRKV